MFVSLETVEQDLEIKMCPILAYSKTVIILCVMTSGT